MANSKSAALKAASKCVGKVERNSLTDLFFHVGEPQVELAGAPGGYYKVCANTFVKASQARSKHLALEALRLLKMLDEHSLGAVERAWAEHPEKYGCAALLDIGYAAHGAKGLLAEGGASGWVLLPGTTAQRVG